MMDKYRDLENLKIAIVKHISFLRGMAKPKYLIRDDGVIEDSTEYPETPIHITDLNGEKLLWVKCENGAIVSIWEKQFKKS